MYRLVTSSSEHADTTPLDTLLNDYELQWYKIENPYILGQKFTFGEESQKDAIMKKETWNTTLRKHKFQENSINLMTANFT